MSGGPDPAPTPPPARAGTERLVALFLAALVAFHPPLLRVFGTDGRVLGVPLLYVYIMAAWAAVIALAALLLERGDS